MRTNENFPNLPKTGAERCLVMHRPLRTIFAAWLLVLTAFAQPQNPNSSNSAGSDQAQRNAAAFALFEDEFVAPVPSAPPVARQRVIRITPARGMWGAT